MNSVAHRRRCCHFFESAEIKDRSRGRTKRSRGDEAGSLVLLLDFQEISLIFRSMKPPLNSVSANLRLKLLFAECEGGGAKFASWLL